MAKQFRETYAYYDADGHQQSIRLSGKNKQDTDLKFQQFLLSKCLKPKGAKLKDFIDHTYIPKFMATLSPTTQYSYRQFIDLNIKPFFQESDMSDINVSSVQEFMNWMATAASRGRKNDLNAATINRVCELLSRIYAIAVEMKVTDDNPVKWKLLRNPGKAAGHHKAVSDAEVDEVKRKIPSIPTEQERLYAALLVYTGMRKEEILGLRWEHVHLDDRCGEIKQAVTYVSNNRAPIVKEPKTNASVRVFFIPEPLKQILQACKQERGYIIHGRDSETPVCYSTQQRIYRRVFKFLGIANKYTNHDWRSTFGTQLKESGLTSAQVADMLGHSDTRMVETVYARTRKESVMKNGSMVEKLNQQYVPGTK